MPVVLLASFPNSRIKPRPSRTTGYTLEDSIPATSVVQILPANDNRTGLLLRNLSQTETLMYGYTALEAQTEGMPILPKEAVNIESPQEVYVYNGSAAPVNYAIDEGLG